MSKPRKKRVRTDNFRIECKTQLSHDEVRCIPYAIADTEIKALRVQNLCKLLFFEKYNDTTLCRGSVFCKYDKSLLNKSLSKNDIYKLAIPEETLREIIGNFEK